MKITVRGAWAVAVLGALAQGASAQQAESVVERIVRLGREESRVMSHLDHLVNKIGPRLTSSDNLTKACEWARQQFEEFGLKPARLEEWGTFPVGFNRGPWSGRMVEPEERTLVCATMAWTAGTDGPRRGWAIPLPESDEDVKRHGDRLKDAWILVRGRGQERWMSACERAGAAGFVRSSGGDLLVTSGNHNLSWEKLPTRVTVYLTKGDFDAVQRHLDDRKDVKLEFDIRNEFKRGPIPLYNVIADLAGTEKPDECVVVGGHIDSWDGATGTNDNGTGVATTLEAARLLVKAGAKPKRTIRFMLWSGEEQGLLGSRAYVQRHREEMAKVSAVLVHDGGTNYVSGISATESMMPLLRTAFAPVLAMDTEKKFKISQIQWLPRGIGSDHDSFIGAGVPGFFWHQTGTHKYGYTHHTQHDTYTYAIGEYQQHSATVIALGALGIADLPELLPRDGVRSGWGERRRMLGVNLADDLTITSLVEGAPAEKAGLAEGDRIVKIGDLAVETVQALREAIQKSSKATSVTVRREDKEVTVAVTFAE